MNAQSSSYVPVSDTADDDFISSDILFSVSADAADRTMKRVLSEIEDLIRGNQWHEIYDLFYPIEDKLPELIAKGSDAPVRERLAFALGQMKRFDEAIRELTIGIGKEPDSFMLHSSIAYTAYNSVYAAKNREIVLNGKLRAERIALAHQHFKKAQGLRPDNVTVFYRQGMLYKDIENKPKKAAPLFEQAIAHWESLSEHQQRIRHQEKKNYVKSLYQLSSCLLKNGHLKNALNLMEKCLSFDEKTDYISPEFKYFKLGKIYYELNRFAEAKDALVVSLNVKPVHQPADFVYELLARTLLALNQPTQAIEMIRRIPKNQRKPYHHWTEAEILCALKQTDDARTVLIRSQERDSMSRHKTLIQLAKIEYVAKNFEKALAYSAQADQFYREKWQNPCDDGLFWQAASLFRLGNRQKALELATLLKQHKPFYPNLNELMKVLSVKC